MLHTIIFIGRSGCGKGTQAALLRERFAKHEDKKILYVETGEHFRHFIRGETYSSKLSNTMYQKDLRQPDFLACFMWSNILIEELHEDMHLVFDGAPRARDEAEILDSALHFYNRKSPAVLYINVGREWSEEKLLKRARIDDISLDKIDKRLDWFDKDVLPALDLFRSDPYYRFLDINGEQSIGKVHSDIVAAYEYQA